MLRCHEFFFSNFIFAFIARMLSGNRLKFQTLNEPQVLMGPRIQTLETNNSNQHNNKG